MRTPALSAALRVLRQDPGYAVAFILTLGLGIGATTAIFSAVEGVLIRPLPYPHADRIVYVQQPLTKEGQENTLFSFPEVADYRAQASTIEEVVEYGDWTFNVVGLGEPRVTYGGLVTSNYFKVLAIHAELGRTLTAEDDSRSASAVAVLTHEFWQRVLGGDKTVIDRTIELSGVVTRVVGVLEPGSHYAGTRRAELYANYPTNAHYMGASMQTERPHRMTDVYALLKAGVPLDAARADVKSVADRLHSTYPADYPAARGFATTITPWREVLVRKARPTLLVLMGAVGLVLLVACANVGNLTLSRLVRRERELAIRAALGATPGQLRRQLLAEHLILAVVGSTLGVLIAWVARGALADYAARLTLRADAVGLNWVVLAFSLVVGAGAAFVFAWAPRLPSAGNAASAAGSSGQRTTSGRAQRGAQRFLVAAQVAVSFVVLVGAGLLVRTFINLQSIDSGFNEQHVIAVKAPNMTQLPPDKSRVMYDELMTKMSAYPGVESVATVNRAPFEVLTVNSLYLNTTNGRYDTPAPPIQLLPTVTSQSFFSTLGVQILKGRAFGVDETAAGTTGPRSAIINQTMAKILFGTDDPINRQFRTSFDGARWSVWRTVVGVARDVRELGTGENVLPTMYESSAQANTGTTLLIRSTNNAVAAGREAARLIHAMDAKRPVTDIAMLTDAASERVAPSRLNATLFGGFAALALAIAAIGVGSVLAFSVSERTKEFGIRMALGSDRGRILRGVLGEGVWLAVAGLLIGGGAAAILSRFLKEFLFEVTSLDALTFVATGLVLALVAVGASLVPARRATRVNPMVALRAQ